MTSRQWRPWSRLTRRRIPVVSAMIAVVLLAGTGAAAAEPRQPEDPDEIWPGSVTTQAEVRACDPAGPTARDAELADTLNPQLTDKMAGYLNAYRISCARVVVQAVRDRGLNPKAGAIAVSTIIVESAMDNLTEAVDHDSVGLYQQRPSMGWGTPEQCTDPVYATNSFLNVMEDFYPNGSWNDAPIGEVAADVQRPAAEYRYRYGVEANDAIKIVDALWNNSSSNRHPAGAGRVVSARSADGRLETFAAGADGVYHAFQNTVNGSWSQWRALGGPRDAQLAIAANRDGRLEVFALSANTFQHVFQTSPSGSWSDWRTFGTGGDHVVAGNNADGRIEVFASNDNGVFHKWQTAPNGNWSDWAGTGGPTGQARLAMATAPDGRLEVFALSDGTFRHLFQTAANGAWSDWQNFGTGGHDLAVGHNADGRIEVFASNDNGVFHKWQTAPNGNWSDWAGTGGPAGAELATERSPDGRIEVFASNDGTSTHSWQTAPNSGFSDWQDFGTGGTELAASHNQDGRIEVFATSASGVYHRWQTGPSGWSDWAWLNDSGPAVG